MWFTYVVVAVSVVAYADAFSKGAPESACKDMIPQHHVPPQKTAPPYTITTSTKVVKAGSPMEVVITGKDSSNTIAGILLQARKGDTPVGQFTVDPSDSFAQLLDCGAPGNSVTHKKHAKTAEKHTVAFRWTPPADLNDEIKFRATVAYNGAVFWVGLESAPVKVAA